MQAPEETEGQRVKRRACTANKDHPKVVAVSHPPLLSSLAHKENKQLVAT